LPLPVSPVSGGRSIEIGVGIRSAKRIPGQKDPVEADEAKDFHHAGRRIEDREAVSRLTGVAIERDKGGNAGGIDAFDGVEVERKALAANVGR